MKELHVKEMIEKSRKLSQLMEARGEKDFQYFRLEREDVQKLDFFFDSIWKDKVDATVFVRNSLEENLSIYDRGGIFLAAYEDSKMAGVCIIDIAKDTPYFSDFIEVGEEEMTKSVIFDTICVHPEYRGFALQKKLNGIGEYLCVQNGYKYGYMTISLFNYYSLKNALDQGFTIFNIKDLYGTQDRNPVTRYLLYLPLGKKLISVAEQYSVSNEDVEAQRKVVELGFYGMKVINFRNMRKFYVSYSKAFYESYE